MVPIQEWSSHIHCEEISVNFFPGSPDIHGLHATILEQISRSFVLAVINQSIWSAPYIMKSECINMLVRTDRTSRASSTAKASHSMSETDRPCRTASEVQLAKKTTPKIYFVKYFPPRISATWFDTIFSLLNSWRPPTSLASPTVRLETYNSFLGEFRNFKFFCPKIFCLIFDAIVKQ